jgi:hypothetical protein
MLAGLGGIALIATVGLSLSAAALRRRIRIG